MFGDAVLIRFIATPPTEEKPVLIVADFNLPAGCGVNYAKMQHDSVYVINSEEEWTNIFTCGSNPGIDFSTQTLLVAFGGTTNGVSNISKELLFENNTYTLTVDITLNDATVPEGWHIVLITDKISTQSVILNLNKHFGTDNILPACTTRIGDVLHYLTDLKTTILKESPPYQSTSSHIVIAKLFDDTEPTAWLVEKFDPDFINYYRICNYPQYAKEWDIPGNGLPVSLSGNVYPPSFNPGFYPTVMAFFDLELTMLKSEEPETACLWEQVTPVAPSNEQKSRLDTVFSDRHELLGNIQRDTLFVINNREDMIKLQGFSEYPDLWMEFEWDNYSIIGGKILRPHGPNEIISQQLSKCLGTSSYKYEMEVKDCTLCYDAEVHLYFWAIYAKKMDSKDVSLTVKTVE
jgi:hypothetical protein